jgi:hypothetical protein
MLYRQWASKYRSTTCGSVPYVVEFTQTLERCLADKRFPADE